MNKEQTLHDLNVSLLQVRSVLLDSQNIHYENLENSTLYQTILKLKNVLCNYNSIVDKLVLKYLQEVHEEYKEIKLNCMYVLFTMRNFTTLKIVLYIYIFSCEHKHFQNLQ